MLVGRHGARAAQLAVRIVEQGVESKIAAYEQIIRDAKVDDRDVAYMGDEILDLQVLARVGCRPRRPTRHPGYEVRERGLGQHCRWWPRWKKESSSWSSRAALGRRAPRQHLLRRNGRLRHTLSTLVALLAGLAIGKA